MNHTFYIVFESRVATGMSTSPNSMRHRRRTGSAESADSWSTDEEDEETTNILPKNVKDDDDKREEPFPSDGRQRYHYVDENGYAKPYVSYLMNADGLDKGFWHHEYSHGIDYQSCSRNRTSREVCGAMYVLWRVAALALMLASVSLALIGCSHYAVVYYATNWQRWIVLAYTFFALISTLILRWHMFKHQGAEPWDPHPRWKLTYTNRFAIVRFTWFLHGLAMCFSCWVFILYWEPANTAMDVGMVSIFGHVVPTAVMLSDFFISGILWPKSMIWWASLYSVVYPTWTVIHHKAKLGHFEWSGSNPTDTCYNRYAISLNATYAAQNLYYVYSPIDWNKPDMPAFTWGSVFFAVPVYAAIVWWLQHTTIYVLFTLFPSWCCRRKRMEEMRGGRRGGRR